MHLKCNISRPQFWWKTSRWHATFDNMSWQHIANPIKIVADFFCCCSCFLFLYLTYSFLQSIKCFIRIYLYRKLCHITGIFDNCILTNGHSVGSITKQYLIFLPWYVPGVFVFLGPRPPFFIAALTRLTNIRCRAANFSRQSRIRSNSKWTKCSWKVNARH